jgi:aminopeptidase YwaD
VPTDYSLLKQVSRTNLERDVTALATRWQSRHTLTRNHNAITEWLQRRFIESGYPSATFFPYTQGSRTLRNVLAERQGTKPAKTTILCAHFDSRQERMGDPEAPAPGANDNATGVAVVLEIARLLAKTPTGDTIRFLLFSGEEQAYWGSAAYARVVKHRTNLRFVFNLDQIGYPPPDRAIFVDRDEGGRLENNAASAALVTRIQHLARTVVKVPTRVDPTYGSDYLSFEAYGIPIVGLYEAGKDYPHYHQSTDTPDKVDFAYVHDMARLALATLLTCTQD